MKLIKFFYYSILITIIGGCLNNPRNKMEIAKDRIDSLFNERYKIEVQGEKKETLPGGTIIILKDDNILFKKSYGVADLSTLTNIDSNTFFNIASVSKQFTAVAILKLHSEGKLDINSSIYDIHPEVNSYLPKERKPFTDITIKDLMMHSSGIPDSRPRDDRNFCLTATDMESIAYLKGIDSLNFAPGTEYEYMNPTFQLLYIIIEKITGQSFETYMKNEIFLPSGMKNTLYFEAERFIPNMAHGYVLDSDSKEFKQYDYGEETFFATKADGGIYTSIEEFINWEKSLSTNKIISQELLNEAYSPLNKVTGSAYSSYQNRPYTSYGYGWFIEEKPNMPKKVYHTGDNGGFQIYAAKYPDKKLTILVFENRNDNSRYKMAEELENIALKAEWI